MSENFDERELSDSELENISGGLLGHHWHPGFGHFGFGGGFGFGGSFGGFGGFVQPTFVVAQSQPQVLLVQEPQYVQSVQTVATTGQCATALATGTC